MNRQRTFSSALAASLAAVGLPLAARLVGGQTTRPVDIATTQPPATQPMNVDPNKVIAVAGGTLLTAGEFQAVVAGLGPQYELALTQPAFRRKIAENILQIKELAEEAQRRKLDELPGVKKQLELREEMLKRQLQIQKQEVLAGALQHQVLGEEAADKAFFEANKSQFDAVKARHILIRTPDSPAPQQAGKASLTDAQAQAKAEQIKQRIQKGEDFAAIAKAESDDPASGLKGGDLGTFSGWTMDGTFMKATQALKPNEIGGPVRTQFGYHIIQLLEDKPRTYEEAKTEVARARWAVLLRMLQERNKPSFDNEFFGVAAPPTTTPSAQSPGPTTAPARNGA